jgi:site-specific recombinase XerD
MPKRRRIRTGIFEDAHGLSVIYSLHGKPIETRFPRGASIDRLERWRTRQIAQRPTVTTAPRDTLTRDVVRYLRRLKGRASYKSEKSHLRAWLATLGRLRRRSITREQIELTIARWLNEGYAARTIRHRCRVLESLYRALDGPDALTPLRHITLPKKPKARPVWVSDETIAAVALNLLMKERDDVGRNPDGRFNEVGHIGPQTRARYLVLVTMGRRPIEMRRAVRDDVDVARRLWFVRTAKGGVSAPLPLNDEQLAAWTLFAKANAWGHYDERSFVRTLHACGWPKGIRPYTARHATAFTIRRRGGDAADVQDQLGHASITTAREFYFATDPVRQAAVSSLLDDRFPKAIFADSHDHRSHDRPRRTAKADGKAKNSEGITKASGSGLSRSGSRKTG